MEKKHKPLTVAIFDDNPIVSQGLAAYFEQHCSYPLQLSYTSTDPDEFLTKYKTEQPDVLVVDVISEKVLGLEVFEHIFSFNKHALVLAYSNVKSRRIIQTLITLGAMAFVPKTEPIDVFEDVFEAVLDQRRVYLPAYIQVNLRKKVQTIALTKMEQKMIPLLIDGKSSKEMASHFFITVSAVNFHKKNLFIKFQVNSIASFVKEVIAQGFSGGLHH